MGGGGTLLLIFTKTLLFCPNRGAEAVLRLWGGVGGMGLSVAALKHLAKLTISGSGWRPRIMGWGAAPAWGRGGCHPAWAPMGHGCTWGPWGGHGAVAPLLPKFGIDPSFGFWAAAGQEGPGQPQLLLCPPTTAGRGDVQRLTLFPQRGKQTKNFKNRLKFSLEADPS